MLVIRKNLNIIPDNEEQYLAQLIGVIESVDELSSLQIDKNASFLAFRLSPSLPKYNTLLLEEILKFNNLLNIRLDLGKSIKSSNTISFRINL